MSSGVSRAGCQESACERGLSECLSYVCSAPILSTYVDRGLTKLTNCSSHSEYLGNLVPWLQLHAFLWHVSGFLILIAPTPSSLSDRKEVTYI